MTRDAGVGGDDPPPVCGHLGGVELAVKPTLYKAGFLFFLRIQGRRKRRETRPDYRKYPVRGGETDEGIDY